MSRALDLSGREFGRLHVEQRTTNGKDGHSRWLCKCACGNRVVVAGNELKRGNVRSCGCLRLDTIPRLSRKNTKHGGSNSRLYAIYQGMKQRCYNPRCPGYELYGGRGITVCPEWSNSFEAFRDWAISHGYRCNLSIDRLDNNKGYEPENCRWATPKEQGNNRRTNKKYTIAGETKTVAEWSKQYSVHPRTVGSRLKKGLSIEEALGLSPE